MEDKNREYSISVICVYNDKQRMNEQLKKTYQTKRAHTTLFL